MNSHKLEKKVTLIIISHKSKKKIKKIINNIKNFKNIIVVDNSNDKSLVYLKKKKIQFFATKNKGYGAAINYASKFVKTKYFLVMNPDIENINYSLIKKIADQSEKIKDNFLCAGPRYIGVKEKSHKQSNSEKKIAKIFAINGACMLFNKKNFDLLDGFDEKFFLFYEENDICKRGNYKKMFSYQLNTIKIRHISGTSVDYSNKKEKNKYEYIRNFHFVKSKIYYLRKHFGFFLVIIYTLVFVIRIFIKSIFYLILRRKKPLDKNLVRLKAVWSFINEI